MALEPGGIIAWLVVGAIAGWLAGQFMKGSGYGLLTNIVVGIIGAFLGGFLLSVLGIGGEAGLIGSIVVAFIGAVILIALVRALPGAARSRPTARSPRPARAPGAATAIGSLSGPRLPTRLTCYGEVGFDEGMKATQEACQAIMDLPRP
jgi:uncharacterized membrane protein YeaQ/YmgE (transglycosylase-associated protein family)